MKLRNNEACTPMEDALRLLCGCKDDYDLLIAKAGDVFLPLQDTSAHIPLYADLGVPCFLEEGFQGVLPMQVSLPLACGRFGPLSRRILPNTGLHAHKYVDVLLHQDQKMHLRFLC